LEKIEKNFCLSGGNYFEVIIKYPMDNYNKKSKVSIISFLILIKFSRFDRH